MYKYTYIYTYKLLNYFWQHRYISHQYFPNVKRDDVQGNNYFLENTLKW